LSQQRLGKGLSALIGDDPLISKNQVLEIDVNDIDINANQPRKVFDDEKLKELAQSIETYGVVQPVIAAKQGGRYQIIAGERRYRAARIAGLKAVPVVVKEYSKRELMEVSLVENLQREDLNPIEEAQAMRMLMDEYSITQEALSQRIGKSRSAVANTLRLLSLPEDIQGMVISGDLSGGHARCLVALQSDDEKRRAANRIVSLGLSVRAAEAMIQKAGSRPAKQSKKAAAPEIQAAEGTLSSALGTRVQISGDLSKGKISVAYYSAEQLQSLFDFLLTAQEEKE